MSQKKTTVNRIPFMTDVAEIAHQIPVSPNIPLSTMARGILAPVKTMLITLQRLVLPSPDKAPTVVSSTHIKASLKPTIIKYPTAISIAPASWKKHPAIVSGKNTNAAVINNPHTPTQMKAALYPF